MKKWIDITKMKNFSVVNFFYLYWADNAIVYQHRLSEWCGKAPELELEMSLANIALDHLGQGRMWLNILIESCAGKNFFISEDELVYEREVKEFSNLTLLELPNTDYAETMVRLYLYVSFYQLVLNQIVKHNSLSTLKSLAEKARVEVTYHLRFARYWIDIMINGTKESKNRTYDALNNTLPFCAEFFLPETFEIKVLGKEFFEKSRELWFKQLLTLFKPSATAVSLIKSNLQGFTNRYLPKGKQFQHSEHLGYMLDELQSVRGKYQETSW